MQNFFKFLLKIMKRITFTPVKKDNNWVIQQTIIVGTFSSEDECKQACEALEQKYSMKNWDEDIFFKQKLGEIPKELFHKEPKPTEKVVRKYSKIQSTKLFYEPDNNITSDFDD